MTDFKFSERRGIRSTVFDIEFQSCFVPGACVSHYLFLLIAVRLLIKICCFRYLIRILFFLRMGTVIGPNMPKFN